MSKLALISVVVLGVGCATDEEQLSSTSSAIADPSAFTLPMLSDAQRASIVRKYDALDPTDLVPRGLLEDTILYFDVNKDQIPKQAYFIVVDLGQYSGHDRFWLVDLAKGSVEPHKVAHGSGSDPDNDGYATIFSNTSNSYQSSLGFYLTSDIYDGTHPHSMHIDGLSPDGSPNAMADTNARDRAIVVHEATYVDDSNTSQQGRSNGCFALDPNIELDVVDRVHDGTLLYAEIKPLNPPVGRAMCGDGSCDGNEDATSCPSDCSKTGGGGSDGGGSNGGGGGGGGGGGDGSTSTPGGCSTGAGAGWLLALALVGVRRRRR